MMVGGGGTFDGIDFRSLHLPAIKPNPTVGEALQSEEDIMTFNIQFDLFKTAITTVGNAVDSAVSKETTIR